MRRQVLCPILKKDNLCMYKDCWSFSFTQSYLLGFKQHINLQPNKLCENTIVKCLVFSIAFVCLSSRSANQLMVGMATSNLSTLRIKCSIRRIWKGSAKGWQQLGILDLWHSNSHLLFSRRLHSKLIVSKVWPFAQRGTNLILVSVWGNQPNVSKSGSVNGIWDVVYEMSTACM